MALDTENKRRSALALFPGQSLIEPVPDNTIEAEDRAHVLGLFSRDLINANWSAGTLIKKTERGTELTTAAVPPGSWYMMIKSVDTSGNESEDAAVYSIDVSNSNDVIEEVNSSPRWPGTKTNYVKHDVSGRLVPESMTTTATGSSIFDEFVPNPYPSSIYESVEKDMGFDTVATRVWIDFQGALGPEEVTGQPSFTFEIDYRNSTESYDGYEEWTIGTASFRYIKRRITQDVSAGVAYLEVMKTVLDSAERTESGNDVAIGSTGTDINFASRFNLTPNIQVTVDSAGALFPVKSNVTSTGFTVNIFTSTGSGSTGVVDWVAIGV